MVHHLGLRLPRPHYLVENVDEEILLARRGAEITLSHLVTKDRDHQLNRNPLLLFLWELQWMNSWGCPVWWMSTWMLSVAKEAQEPKKRWNVAIGVMALDLRRGRSCFSEYQCEADLGLNSFPSPLLPFLPPFFFPDNQPRLQQQLTQGHSRTWKWKCPRFPLGSVMTEPENKQ